MSIYPSIHSLPTFNITALGTSNDFALDDNFTARHRYRGEIQFCKKGLKHIANKSDYYGFGQDSTAAKINRIAIILQTLFAWTLTSLANTIKPHAGEGKDRVIEGIFRRVIYLAALMFLVFPGLAGTLISLPFHFGVHPFRRAISAIENDRLAAQKQWELQATHKNNKLKMMSYNVAFVPDGMATLTDLRNCRERASEISNWLTNILEPKDRPEVICFNETFNTAGTKVLVDGLQKQYPYIYYNMLPTGGADAAHMSNGGLIASMYPIETEDGIRITPFTNMLGPEALSPRGPISFMIRKGNQKVRLHSIHTQALLGTKRSQARLKQFKATIGQVHADQKRDGKDVLQVILGDFNLSKTDFFGRKNSQDDESEALLEKWFTDAGEKYYNEHGKDGTFANGPFQDNANTLMHRLLDIYNDVHQRDTKGNTKPHRWGYTDYLEGRKKHGEGSPARFDRAVVLKSYKHDATRDKVEHLTVTWGNDARGNPIKKESAPSDHRPIMLTMHLDKNWKFQSCSNYINTLEFCTFTNSKS